MGDAPIPPRWTPAAVSGGSAGLAAWCTAATLERVSTQNGAVRVAMLPGPEALLLAVAAGMGAALLVLAALRRSRAGRSADGHLLLPLVGTLTLAAPYLPLLPDWVPVLTVLAGPARWFVWAAAIVLICRSFVAAIAHDGRVGSRLVQTVLDRRGAWTALALGVSLTGLTAWHVMGTPVFPGGDEPHYLIVAQSLWRDGDLRIENNHERGDYREYFRPRLAPHFLTRGEDGEIYSIHPIGLPVLMAPVYALGGYLTIVAAIAVVGALAAMLLWRWTRRLTQSPAAAWFTWAAIVSSAPFVFNSITVYPEVPAALAVMLVMATSSRAWPADVGRGIALAALPWLSTKYAPMAGALGLIVLWRLWRDAGSPNAGLVRRGALVLVPVVVGLAAWFAFFQWIWGSPLPSAPYGGYHQTSLAHVPVGVPGLLFDQEYGVLAYAPVLLLGLTGLVAMVRRGGARRTVALEIALAFGFLIVTVGAFRIWWGGSAGPGRPVASGLLLLGVPVAFRYLDTMDAPARRAAYVTLIVLTACLTIVLATVQDATLLAAGRDGSATWIEWFSPSWRAWSRVPSFIVHPTWVATPRSILWVATALGASWGLGRLARGLSGGADGLAALLTIILAAVFVSCAVPFVWPAYVQPDVNLAMRGRVRLLDDYDAHRRPLAIVYDPWRRADPKEVPPLVELLATRSDHRPAPRVPLLLNARYSLPAGTYALSLNLPNPPPPGSQLSLIVGSGPLAVTDWALGRPAVRFTLPVDASFVGFRANPVLEPLIEGWRLQPIAVESRSRRLDVPDVSASARYGEVAAYIHQDSSWLEPGGFWSRGDATTAFTLAARRPVGLRLRNGAVPVSLTIQMGDTVVELGLAPGETHTIPAHALGPVLVTVDTTGGFRPVDVDPESRDQRLLGCWIEPFLED